MDDYQVQFFSATSFLTGFPADAPETEEPQRMLPYLAVVALGIGAVSWLLGWVSMSLASRVGGAFLGTILVNGFWTFLSRGQDFGAVPGVVRRLQPGGDRNDRDGAPDLGMVALLLVILVKLGGVAVLLYQGWLSWLVLVPLLSALFTCEMAIRHGFLPMPDDVSALQRYGFVILILAFCLVGGLRAVFAGLFVYLLVLVLGPWSRRRFADAGAAQWVNGGAELIECAVLLAAVILLS